MSESVGVGLKGLSQDTEQKGSWTGSQEHTGSCSQSTSGLLILSKESLCAAVSQPV